VANRYPALATYSWNSSTANWSATSGGAGGATAPGTADVAVLDGVPGVGTITRATGAAATIQGLQLTSANTTLAGATTLTLGTGGLTFSAGTWTGTFTVNLNSTSSVNLNGKTITSPLTLGGTGTTVTLGSSGTTTKAVTLAGGTLALGANTLTCASFLDGTTSTRTLDFTGGGNIQVNATAAGSALDVQNAITLTGTPNVTVNATTAIAITASTGTNPFNLTLTGSLATMTLTGYAGTLSVSGFTGTFATSGTLSLRSGNLDLSTFSGSYGGTGTLGFGSASAQTFKPNGSLPWGVSHTGAGTLTLQAALTQTNTAGITQTSGQLDQAGFAVTCDRISISGTNGWKQSGGTLTVTGTGTSFANSSATNNFADATTVRMTSGGSGKTFNGAGAANLTLVQAGSGQLNIIGVGGGNTSLADLQATTTGTTITLTYGQTLFASNFTLGNTNFQSTVSGTPCILDLGGFTRRVYNNTFTDVTVTNGTLLAYTSDGNVDGGGNTGIVFTAPASSTSQFFSLLMM